MSIRNFTSYSARVLVSAAALLLTCAAMPVYAQLGNGWVLYSPTKKIHLDDENGLQTFNWIPYKSVGSNTICADYSYDSATDTETFRIIDNRSNRSEIRLQNEYSTGRRQFQGYVLFDAPLNDESLFQIFGSTSGATLCMMRGYSSSGGKIRVVGGIGDIATGVYGVEKRINVIHDQDNYVQFYVNGVFKGQFSEAEMVSNYHKYGCYGTLTTPGATVKWRAARSYRDGFPPGSGIVALPGAITVNPGGGSTSRIDVTGFGGTVTLSASNVPPGATASFNPPTIAGGGGSSTLTLTTTAGLATGHYPLTITATDATTNAATTLNLGLLPAGWAGADIGGPGEDGWASYSNGVFTVNGSGSDVWGTADKFNFAWQNSSGDTTITARIDSQENTDAWAKSGVMVRESTNANAKYVFVSVTPTASHGVSMQFRSGTGSNAVDLAQINGPTTPYWVRLVRSGDTFTGYHSPDGVNWTQTGATGITMSGDVLIGLAVTAHDDADLNTTAFSNVSVPPSFLLATTPLSQTVIIGSNTAFQVDVTGLNGFANTVDLGAAGVPAGATAGFSPPSVSGSGLSTLTISTTGSTPAGSYPITITGTDGTLTRTNLATLIVSTPGNNLVWNSTSSTAWDTTTPNWFKEETGLSDVFQQSNNVVFADRAGVVTNVTIASGVSVIPTTMTVTAETNHFTLSGAGGISGIASLVKTGRSTLTLATTNDYTGVTTISGGVLRAPVLANGGTASSIGAAVSNPTNLVLDGGTLRWIGATNTTANRGFTLTTNGGALESSPPLSANLTLSGAIVFSGAGARTLTLAGTDPNPLAIGGNVISAVIADPAGGPLTLVKNGNNAWNLSGNNTYSGGSLVNGGRLRANTSTNAFGSGPVMVAEGGQAYCNVGGPFGNSFFIAGNGIAETEGNYGALRLAQNGANAVNTITLTGNSRITARGATGSGAIISGKITGDFALEFGNSGSGAGVLTLSNNANDWAGNTTISHGTLKLGAANALPHGTEKGDVILNNSNPSNNSVLDLNGISPTINGLASAGADPVRCFITNSSAAAATLTVGDNDATATFGGVIRNGTGTVGLVKTGAGVQTLNGASTYTGATIVSNGTLVVNGSLGNSTVTVMNGAMLGGNGTLSGSVTTDAGSLLSPGSSIGALTVSNTVTLQGTTLIELNKAAGTNDVIRGATTISYGGTLALTNLGGALAAGDSFKLFDAASYSGAFTGLTPPVPAPGLVWDTNALTVSGTLTIAAAAPPVISSIIVSGGAVVIAGTNGPADGTYFVLSSTNLAVPASNWTVIATNTFSGSGSFSFTNATDPAAPQAFYRLQLP